MRSIRFESFDVACSGEDGTGVTGGKTWGTGTGFIRQFGGKMSDDGEFGGPAYDLPRNLRQNIYCEWWQGRCVWNDKVRRQRFNVQREASRGRCRV